MNYFANDGTNLPSQHHRIEPVLRKNWPRFGDDFNRHCGFMVAYTDRRG